MIDTAALPKQELLLKLLKMTASPNEGEALTAIRKANELLTSAGWDWDKLIHAKITVVADPFASIPTPAASNVQRAAAAPPASPAQRASAKSPPPAPPPRAAPPRPPQPKVHSTKTNAYSGHCYCCGDYVAPRDGFIFNPNDWNSAAKSQWATLCKGDNNILHYIPNSAVPKRKKPAPSPSGPAPSLADL